MPLSALVALLAEDRDHDVGGRVGLVLRAELHVEARGREPLPERRVLLYLVVARPAALHLLLVVRHRAEQRHLRALPERKDRVRVLEEDAALRGGLARGGEVLLQVELRLNGLSVDERTLEEAELHLYGEDAADGSVDVLDGDASLGEGGLEPLLVVRVDHAHVHAGLERHRAELDRTVSHAVSA